MGRSKTYWILVSLGALTAVTGILMLRSSGEVLPKYGRVVGWAGVALVLLARIFFSRRQQPKPPTPKDNLKIS